MNINSMSINELVDYINLELSKDRSLKDIEINDFKVNERVSFSPSAIEPIVPPCFTI